jgi:copper chaperone CopZ
METIQFKTTIKCSGCVVKVTPFLDEAVGNNNWEVEYTKPDKVLTVVGEKDAAKVIQALEKAGYKAEKI